MRKGWIVGIVLVLLLVIFFFPKSCGGGGGIGGPVTLITCDCFGIKAPSLIQVLDASYTSCYGICLKSTCEKKILYPGNNQTVGGCAGVAAENIQECCANWAAENGMAFAGCIGSRTWTIENNTCSLKCQEDNEKTWCTSRPDACAAVYAPVCGCIISRCEIPPCDVTCKNYSNSCVACGVADYWLAGECLN